MLTRDHRGMWRCHPRIASQQIMIRSVRSALNLYDSVHMHVYTCVMAAGM